MTARWRAALLCLCAALLTNVAALAHTRSESLSVWQVEGSEVRATVTVPETEAARLSTPPADAELGSYLATHLGAQAEGRPCEMQGAPVATAATRGFRRIELRWRCPSATGIELHSSAFVDVMPTHLMYARVQVGQRYTEQLLDADRRSLAVSAAGELQSAGFLEYLRLGWLHIVTGPDHIAFLLGLVLVSVRFRDLALVITGFTLGHSVTLALAVTGWLRPEPFIIDVLIALTIGLVGAENLAAASRRAGVVAGATGLLLLALAAARLAGAGRLPLAVLLGAALFAPCYLLLATRLREAAPLRAGVTAVFGLVHGFAFANDLIEMQLPTGRLAQLLFGFNLGVEVGQLLIVAALLVAATLVLRFARRLQLALPRQAIAETGAAGLVGLSVYWIVLRSFA